MEVSALTKNHCKAYKLCKGCPFVTGACVAPISDRDFPAWIGEMGEKIKQLNAQYQPKGGMCASCENRDSDCSSLPFSTMPVLSGNGDEIIVRCTEFQRQQD